MTWTRPWSQRRCHCMWQIQRVPPSQEMLWPWWKQVFSHPSWGLESSPASLQQFLNILVYLVDLGFSSEVQKNVALTPLGHQRAPCIQPEAPIWSAKHRFFKKADLPFSACSLEHRFYNNFLYQQNAVICLITSNSGLVALPLRLWDLVHSGGDKHGYQVPTLVQGLSGCGAGKAWAFRLPRFAGGYQRWWFCATHDFFLSILLGGNFLLLLI